MAHETVFKKQAVEALVWNPDGIYVDATYGRGGHSKEILDCLGPGGKLMVIDKDPEAMAHARAHFSNQDRVCFSQGSFADLKQHIAREGWVQVDGVLMDLGVSSPQLDQSDRGFSFMKEGPLDMRMDTSKGMTAAEWLDQADEKEMSRVFKEYGEERFHRRIASAIAEKRRDTPLKTTSDLVHVIEESIPFRDKHKHPATRVFQAVRIFINDELAEISQALESAVQSLTPGGRLVVISFHSLEDRLVKRFMKQKARGDQLPARLPVRDDSLNRELKVLASKVRPPLAEVRANPRARSAIMRVAERLAA